MSALVFRKPKPGKSLAECGNETLIAAWNVELNGGMTPSQISVGNGRYKAWWDCYADVRHHWRATVPSRLKLGSGCPLCSGHRVDSGVNDLATTHPEISARWHQEKNCNLTPSQVFAKSHKEVWWHCAKDERHYYPARISTQVDTKGHGCAVCAGKFIITGVNDLATTHPDIAAQWHSHRNGELLPTQVPYGTDRSVWWQCDLCSHEWCCDMKNRTALGQMTGCPQCSARSSRSEQWMREYMAIFLDNVELQSASRIKCSWRKLSYMTIDVVGNIPNTQTKVAVEYDGEYWHRENSTSRSLERDTDKTIALLELGYVVIRIRENKLCHVDYSHPFLLQLNHTWSVDKANMQMTTDKVIQWLKTL